MNEKIDEAEGGDRARKKPTRGENELSMANEILRITSNLEEDDAFLYAELYIKAQKEAVKIAGEEYDFDIEEVYRLVAEVEEVEEIE